MRILHIVPTYLPARRYGGPIYSVHGLCRGLARRGHHVDVYTTNVDGPSVSNVPLNEPVLLDGVNVTYFATGLGRRLYRSPNMAAVLSRNVSRFDVVHLHSVFLWPTAAGAATARLAGIPYVISPRGMLVPELIERKSRLLKLAWINLFERHNIAEAASVHVTAEIEGVNLTRLGLKPKRIDMIPNAFDLPPEAVSILPDAKPSCTDGAVVLHLGRISWIKGFDRLVPAMAHVPGARLLIAGNDDEGYTRQLNALIAQHGVAPRTQFLGAVQGPAKWQAFARADIFALASYSENFGIAVLEAMACGIPVVVTPEVGLADVVERTGAGLVAQGDPEQFGRAIARLVADPALRRQMGAAGRAAAREHFSWSAVAARMEALYQDLVCQAPHRASIDE
ncbi:glycosyltransferase [Methylocystis sp. FS]|uniref:glycosyltransferase n=1 Tax=Methylocystis silviterrae TaxID=2743612 RepID=UPI001583E0A1|nr:glycosyltransferase [Methylocystis silviterrae]NUJ81627.1 glycosyltransferase [Methylocystis silviterrae]